MAHMMTCIHYSLCDIKKLPGGCPPKCPHFLHGGDFNSVESEICFCNGKAIMRESIINKLMDMRTHARGQNHAILSEVIGVVEGMVK